MLKILTAFLYVNFLSERAISVYALGRTVAKAFKGY